MSKPISWAAMAHANANVEVTKATPAATTATTTTPATTAAATTTTTATTNTSVDSTEPEVELDPLLADVMEKSDGEEDTRDIEEAWKADPFEAFKQGVAVVFLLWDALQLIIEQALVDEADAMSDILEFDTIQAFIDTKGKANPEDLEIWLNQTLEQNFYTIIEDGSTKNIAKSLVDLYETCMVKKNFQPLHDLMQKAFEQMNSEEERQVTCFVDDLDDDHHHHHHHHAGDDDGDFYSDEDYDDEDYDDDDDEDYEDEEDEEKSPKAVETTTTTTTTTASNQEEQANEPTKQDDGNDDDGWSQVKSKPNARPFKLKTKKK